MINAALYTLLSGYSPLTDLVGDRIYPLRADKDTANPCVVYQKISGLPEDTKDSQSIDEIRFQVSCWGDTPDDADEVAERVRDRLHGYSGMVSDTNIDWIKYDGVQPDDYDEGADSFRTLIEFIVWLKR